MTSRPAYKLFTPADWATFQSAGVTQGSAHDMRDGFLHFSAADQLSGTLSAHYAGAGPLILAEVAGHLPGMRWEASRGGALFPHLYATLHMSSITRSWPLSRGRDGTYRLPDLDGTDL